VSTTETREVEMKHVTQTGSLKGYTAGVNLHGNTLFYTLFLLFPSQSAIYVYMRISLCLPGKILSTSISIGQSSQRTISISMLPWPTAINLKPELSELMSVYVSMSSPKVMRVSNHSKQKAQVFTLNPSNQPRDTSVPAGHNIYMQGKTATDKQCT